MELGSGDADCPDAAGAAPIDGSAADVVSPADVAAEHRMLNFHVDGAITAVSSRAEVE